MQQLIMIIHVLAAIAIIALVLMQHGRGADVGASFGSGASNTMFGSTGSLPFLVKLTAVCAAVFFAASLSLSYLATNQAKQTDILTIPTATPVKTQTPSSETTGVTFAPGGDMRQDNKQDNK